jgi:arylsulfatase A-like enzyme
LRSIRTENFLTDPISVSVGAPMSSNRTNPPNILFIMTDQQRLETLGCYGNSQIKTPHLDQMAQHADCFDNHYCCYPVCTPSRYSTLSGLYVHQHTGRSNHCTLPPGIATFPRLLRQAGYRTAAVGKMHFTPTYLDVGYERMELAEQDGPGRFDDDYHRELMRAGLVDAIDLYDQRNEYRQRAPYEYWQSFGAGPSNLPEKWHSTQWIGDRAMRHLEDWTAGGNLLTVSFVKPHHPFDPPARWLDLYDPEQLEILPGWTDEIPEADRRRGGGYFDNRKLSRSAVQRVTAHYYATISQIDDQVGRMLDLLRRRNMYDNTIVVFTSDHGEFLGFHHMLLKGGYPYDPLLRVPLLIKWAGQHDSRRRTGLCSNIDLAPSLMHAAGVEPANTMAGLDLADPTAQREVIFAETVHGAFVVRTATEKLIWSARHPSLYFDLSRDPHEMDSRFEDPACRARVAELQQAIARWVLFDAPAPATVDRDAAQVARGGEPTSPEDVRAWFDQAVQPFLTQSGAVQ